MLDGKQNIFTLTLTFSKDNIIIVDGHLPRAEDEDASSEEGQDASAKDEGVPVVKVCRLHQSIRPNPARLDMVQTISSLRLDMV